MSVSTNGQICYGILLDEGVTLPWSKDEFDGDIDDWWVYGILGFRHSFEMFTPLGDWIGGKEWPQEKVNQYYDEKYEFIENNPKLPIELVNYCSDAYPVYILAVPQVCNSARRGFPEKFNPTDLVITDKQKSALVEFCDAHGIEFKNEPAWYLSSYWG